MRKKRLIQTFFVLMIGLVTLAAPAAYAVGNDTSVVNSGDDANINASVNQSSSVAVSNNNTAVVSQDVNAHSNTGHNEASGNIGGSSIHTGNAGVNVLMETNANSNTTAIAGASQGSINMTDVVNTGDDADVNTSANTSSHTFVQNSNDAVVTQTCGSGGLMSTFTFTMPHGGCTANTGHNEANDNIGGAGITTGNAGIGLGMSSQLNDNKTVIGGAGNGLFINDTLITNTGDNADVNASVNDTHKVGVFNHNSAFVHQMLNAHSNTGYNDANDNIGGAGVLTGKAGVEMLMVTDANSNKTGIGSNLSPLLSNIDDIVNTGDDLYSNTSTTSNSSAFLKSKNYLMSFQNIFEDSNSGHNDSNDNIGASTTLSNMAGVSVGMATSGNENANVLGNVLGSLLGFLLM